MLRLVGRSSNPGQTAMWYDDVALLKYVVTTQCGVKQSVLSVRMPKLLPNSQSIVCLLPWSHGTLLVNGWNLVFEVCLCGNQGTAATPRSRLWFEIFHYKLVYMPMLYINIFNKQQHRYLLQMDPVCFICAPPVSLLDILIYWPRQMM